MLQAQKHSKLKELVVEVQEEQEPEGEDMVGPSGVAGEQSSGNDFLCFFFQIISPITPFSYCVNSHMKTSC